MAELYGYDPVGPSPEELEKSALEGAIKLSVVKRRERNPRNRLLAELLGEREDFGELVRLCELGGSTVQ